MKKASILFLAILLIGSMLLTSCADTPWAGDSEPSSSELTDQTENNSGDNNNTEEIQKDSTDLLIFTLQEDDTYSVTGIKDKTVAAELVIPSTYEGKSVTSIGKKAFEECYAITSVTIPDSVTHIGEYAFYSCIGLADLTIGNGVTHIDECAFGDCGSLVQVVIPDSVTEIGEGAFCYGWRLIGITIGSQVTCIGDDAFSSCPKLAEVINQSNLTITAGSAENGMVAYFAKEVHTGESKIVNQNGYLFYTYGSTHYLMGYTGNDTALILPENYNGEPYQIYDFAFYNRKNVLSVTLGQGVTDIGEYAFDGCDKLVEVINKSDLTITAGSKENGLVAENAIEVHTGETRIANVHDYLFYRHSNGTHYLLGYTGSDTELILPENDQGQQYVIHDYAFCYFPETTMIRSDFAGSNHFISVTIPDGVTAIGRYAFEYCGDLVHVTIGNGVTSIGMGAFGNCRNLTDLTIGTRVACIDERAFGACVSLTDVTLPESVTEIGESAFSGCSELARVTFENTEGWYFGETPVSSEVLADPSAAAEYLSAYHWGNDDFVLRRR